MQPQPQEQPAPTPAPPPAAPALPQIPAAITTVGPDGKPVTLQIPSTPAELRELRAQREELSNQLVSATQRRRDIAQEIQQTSTRDVATRAGLEARMAVLDQRILQLETDIAITGRLLSSAPAQLLSVAEYDDSNGGGHFEEGLMIGGSSVAVAAALLLLFFRRRWKRAAPRNDDLGSDAIRHLQRLEQGMDAIAIEIERVTEGQRFVTKLLSESSPALGTGRRGQPAHAELEDPAKR